LPATITPNIILSLRSHILILIAALSHSDCRATTAFAQEDAAAARAQWRGVADQLRPKLPKLADFMDEVEADVLAYMDFPAAHRAKLHSTDALDKPHVADGALPRRPYAGGIFGLPY